MKICQTRLKIIALILMILIVNVFIINTKTASAFNPLSLFQIDNDAAIAANKATIKQLKAQANALSAKEATAIKTAPIGDKTAIEAKIAALEAANKALIADNKQYTWTRLWEELKDQSFEVAGSAFKSALGNFLNTMAADTATYLATGNEGQGPMIETRPLSKIFTDAGDNAVGTFLETLGKKGPLKFNLCQPDFNVMLKINLGLQKYTSKKPTCTFTEMTKNWDKALNDKDFLPKFQDMFNPWSNDLGIALTLQTNMETEINNQTNLALENAKKNVGYKDVTAPISGFIKTPASIVAKAAFGPLENATTKEKTWTGTVADAIDIFINTLAGKLMDKWLKKGIVENFPDNNNNSLADPDAQNPAEGIAGAENRMRSLTEPSFKVRGDYDILAELTMCPDPNKAGPTNCVIDEKFRQAIEKRLTVKQAMDQGYLNPNGIFGFTSDGLEPRFNEGYPYRSMLILRKFRILPIGWEAAAQKIKDNQAQVGGTKNLSDLVNCTASWCYGLVDPNWVLKAEQNYCKKEGAGPEILSEEVLDGGLSIVRNDTYCADEQSCIKERSDGACQLYGYCTEERRRWDFNGKSCEPRDNTCQTFQLGEQTISYLQNTLDFGVCNAGNAGCKKYATNGSYNSTSKTIDWDGTGDSVYLNKSAATCEAEDQGCYSFIRIIPEKTETYADIKTAGLSAAYNRFSSTNLIYEKLLPDYLKNSCYSYDANGNILDGQLLDNAPAQCQDFVRQCKEEEAGCELYTNVADNSKIPAKVGPNDYCPAECVGYNTFVQQATNFDSSRDAYFIPKTAKTCSAEAVGCEQFTNLDEVAKGGEGVEYYTLLRQCIKKTGNEASCGEFYNWEGSDESGYQLKVVSLKINGAEPALTENDAALCTEAIYNLPASNPAYNADCRQFYNRQGDIYYHLYSRTISCSDDCHPYRKTVAIDDTASSCIGGGVWNDLEKTCLYMAIPGLGGTCSAAQNGCREYTGNTGNNIRNIFIDDFSGGTTGGWVGVNGSVVAPSSEAVTLVNNKGNSLSVAGSPFSAKRTVGTTVTAGKSYVVNFVAKAAASADLNLSLVNASGLKANFAKVTLGTDWQIFQTNLDNLNHEATSSEYFLLEASGNFYIDSITLTEIIDRYYLVKNSWKTPTSCDADQSGAPDELYMLGCGQYKNRDNKTYYLKSFGELCSESAVGCELMIDTKNSTATTTEEFINSGTTTTVPADEFIYAVYDKEKLCTADAKGCELLGEPYNYENTTLYGDTYLINNPDKYSTILCGTDAVGCQTFTYDKGEKYFKDPGDMVCEWRREALQGATYGWFKKKVKKCGSSLTEVCLTDADCSGANKCQLETTDIACATNSNNTLGLGGVGSSVSQPARDVNSNNWAGICAAASSGCGEYIDPKSEFSDNKIFNGDFQILAVSNTDGWDSGISQDIILEPYTTYRLARTADAGSLTLSGCPNALYEINNENNLVGPATSIAVSEADYANSKIFSYRVSAAGSCKVTAGNSNGSVELKKVVIDYQLAQNLDSTNCNGVVDFSKGCVLFNQRSQNGAALKALDYDADIVAFSSQTVDKEKDSNIILKVTPDRTCGKWLACRSYIKDEKGNNICYDVGSCDAVDENGNCSSFLISPKENQVLNNIDLDADKISNLSGYAKVGIQGGSIISDYYPLGAMKQKGEVIDISNGGFEYYDSSGYPIGWNWTGQEATGKSWDNTVFSVINNPISAQIEGIGYAKEGASFLKLGSSYDATSEITDIIPSTDYVITAYVNTKNLKKGQAKIDIIGNADTIIASGTITQDLGNDWQFQVGNFTTRSVDSGVRIKLYSNDGGLAGSEGNFYFDDIKIRPALNSKDFWYTTQSCRLYSKTDSLSCDYYEDSGARQKGWYGYCLEYDRAPGNPNACILWYPIDKVKGDGIEEGAGYLGKIPVYYCAEAKNLIPLEKRQVVTRAAVTGCDRNGPIPHPASANYTAGGGYVIGDLGGCGDCGRGQDNWSFDLRPAGSCLYDCKSDGTGWYVYDGFENVDLGYCCGISCGTYNEATSGVKYYNPNTGEVFDDVSAYCSKVVQTVTTVGANKYWAGRVYKGSDWKVYFGAQAVYQYDTDGAPFGSIIAPSNIPYEWDGSKADGYQPLLVRRPNSNVSRASSPYMIGTPPITGSFYGVCSNSHNICLRINDSAGNPVPYNLNKADCSLSEGDCQPVIFSGNPVAKISLLFAKSYGAWSWDETKFRYMATTTLSWGPPGTNGEPNNGICPLPSVGQPVVRGANSYCAIVPVVSNIKVNGLSTQINLVKNGFINLTFNSKADSSQLPLVMYAIDWGDGEKTTVSGVEMRDRPNANVPHSMYHLYSYWDLKSKQVTDQIEQLVHKNIIYCGNAGSSSARNFHGLTVDIGAIPTNNYCVIKPRVQIKDNWGWYNKGTAINDDGQWDAFSNWIVVKEK